MDLQDLPEPAFEGTVPVEELEVDGENPNEQSDEMFGLLCSNMRQKGWIGNAIVTDTEGLIADGEHRWRAAKEIGLDEVPVKQYEIDDSDRRLWRQELNKISGTHDPKRDALEYDYLLSEGKSDAVRELTDAADEDLDDLLAQIKVDRNKHVPYEYEVDHNVYFEDCVQGMRDRLEEDSVDCVVTDPPYGVEADLSNSVTMSHDGFEVDRDLSFEQVENDDLEAALDLFDSVAAELSRVLKPDGHAYVFGAFTTYHLFADILDRHGLNVQNCLVWTKNDSTPLRAWTDDKARYAYNHEFILFAVGDAASSLNTTGDPDDVFDYPSGRYAEETRGDLDHPTQKPVALLSDILTNSTDSGDLVLDPFMGSGSTAVAAVESNRSYVGFELESEYRPVIERRIGDAIRTAESATNAEQTSSTGDD